LPLSTLFPYTSLFRSCYGAVPRGGSPSGSAAVPSYGVAYLIAPEFPINPLRARPRAHHHHPPRRSLRTTRGCHSRLPATGLRNGDRKSTRLNSSHVKI